MSLSLQAKRRVAARYAQALFDIAKEAGTLDKTSEALNALVRLFEESQEFRYVAVSPIVSRQEKLDAIATVVRHATLSAVVEAWLNRLAENGRLDLLPQTGEAFAALLRKERGDVQVFFTSASALKPSHSKELTRAVSKAIGRGVDPVFLVDQELIGGVKIRIGSNELDASVKGKLARAAERLYDGIQV